MNNTYLYDKRRRADILEGLLYSIRFGDIDQFNRYLNIADIREIIRDNPEKVKEYVKDFACTEKTTIMKQKFDSILNPTPYMETIEKGLQDVEDDKTELKIDNYFDFKE